jgi:hypothetical protein
VIPIREWLEAKHPRLLDAWLWVWLRLTGSRCFAQGCGRLLLLHTPRQWDRCCSTPLAVSLTVRGWLHARGLDPAAIDAWCGANGIDPGAVVQPVVPVSHATVA